MKDHYADLSDHHRLMVKQGVNYALHCLEQDQNPDPVMTLIRIINLGPSMLRQLREFAEVFEDMNTDDSLVTDKDVARVEKLANDIPVGGIMSAAQRIWARKCASAGDPGAEFVVGPCKDTVVGMLADTHDILLNIDCPPQH